MKIKRWLALQILGLFVIGIGFSIIIEAEIFGALERIGLFLTYQIFGQASPNLASSFLFLLGLIFLIFGFRQLMKSLLHAVNPLGTESLVEILYEKRNLEKGPKIVVVGGGTGIPVLLRGLKEYTSNITAIVTVADDGGSSGRLRGEFGILPPGDIRNCLIALADKESLMEEILQYRFTSDKELGGHNLGNLLIAAMTDITGSFDEAIREMSKVLAIRGQVLPSTLEEIVLGAEMIDGEIVYGESKIPKGNKGIKRVFIEPSKPKAFPKAIEAIKEADIVLLGPGSLYTSVLPNLLIKEISDAIKETKGIKAYVCNVMTQPGETDGFSASRHAREIIKHVGLGTFEHIIINNMEIPSDIQRRYRKEGSIPVRIDRKQISRLGIKLVEADLLYQTDVVRHDPKKLANTILKLLKV